MRLVAAQGAGTLPLANLGSVDGARACTDLTTKVWAIDAPFAAGGDVATSGRGLAAPYLAAWVIAVGASIDHARDALQQLATLLPEMKASVPKCAAR